MDFPIKTVVFTVMDKRSSSAGKLPTAVWIAFSAVNYIHRKWFWYRKSQIWRPGNCFELALGIGLQLAAGDNKAVQLVSKIVEVSLHVIKCVHAMERLKSNWAQLVKHLDPNEVIHVKIDLERVSQRWILSPSTHIYLEEKRQILNERSKRVFNCSINIFRDVFLLSMYVLDAQAAFQGHELQVPEVVVHTTELLSHSEIVFDILNAMSVQGDPHSVLSTENKKVITKKLEVKKSNSFGLRVMSIIGNSLLKGLNYMLLTQPMKPPQDFEFMPFSSHYSFLPDRYYMKPKPIKVSIVRNNITRV